MSILPHLWTDFGTGELVNGDEDENGFLSFALFRSEASVVTFNVVC